MKGYFVWSSPEHEWGDYIHGTNHSEAKSRMWFNWDGGEIESWTDMRANRIPALDGIPITQESIRKTRNDNVTWYPICTCEICKGGE